MTEEKTVDTAVVPALEDVEEALRDVVDPELGVNVFDLDLIYGIEIEDTGVVKLDMTLTSAACPLSDIIEDQTVIAIVRRGLAPDLEVNWVWMPPWGPNKVTHDGREHLRALGFTV